MTRKHTKGYKEALKRIEENFLAKEISLDLKGLKLTELPLEIGKLKHLIVLNISYDFNTNKPNQLESLPKEIGQLTNLQILSFDGNQLTELPKEITQLTNLRELHLGGNQLSELPKEIGQLTNLQTLSLSRNQLSELPKEIGQLTNLQTLSLSLNQLSELPKEIGQLTNLQILFLDSNQLKIPSEIIQKYKEPQVIINYYFENVYKAKESDTRPLKEVKVMLVGQGRVGKTSLVRYLADNDPRNPDERSTHGILRKKWNVGVTENETGKEHDVQLNVWDFGGQDIQHQTHQFFLSKRSLYLLVLDAGYDETRNKLDYWLKKIQIFGENSPVFVAVNKSDENSLKLAYNDLKEKYNIKEFFDVSCEDGRQIPELREAIKREIGNLKDVFQPIRKEWFDVKETLEEIREDYISIDDYRKICREKGVTGRQSQDTLLILLHELGVMLNFSQYETKVLNPEWVTRGVYQVVTSTEVMKNNGILTPELLDAEMQELNEELSRENKDYLCYPREKYIFITDLMQQFELSYPVAGTKNFFVSSLLPKESHYVGDWKEKDCLGFRYNYANGLLHESIISRFIVKMNRYILNNTQWLTGVLLHNGHKNKALVKADLSSKIVTILIDGNENTRREFLGVIREKFDDIHDDLKSNKPAEEVPHYDYPNYFISYEHLLQLEKAGIAESQVTIEGELVNYDVKRLLNGVSTPREREAERQKEEKYPEKNYQDGLKDGKIIARRDDKEIDEIFEGYIENGKTQTSGKIDDSIQPKEKVSLFKTIATLVSAFIVIFASIGLYDYLQKQGYLTERGFYISLVFTVVFIVVIATFALVHSGAIPANLIPDILKPVFGLIASADKEEKQIK
jgi:internalin A